MYRKSRLREAAISSCASDGEAACSLRTLSFIRGRLHYTGQVTCLPEELWFLTLNAFLDLPRGSTVHPHLHPPVCKPTSTPWPLWDLTVRLTSFFTDTCRNEDHPSAPWTKITPPLSSPRRAVIGKHLKYCDHLQ